MLFNFDDMGQEFKTKQAGPFIADIAATLGQFRGCQRMKIVAFYSSCSGTGKSTSSKFVQDKFPSLFHKISFADGVREDLDRLLETLLTYEQLVFHRENKDAPIPGVHKSYRQLLIEYGTGFCRNQLVEDYWVLRLAEYIKKLKFQLDDYGYVTIPTADTFVLDDLRFPNEYKWLKQQGALLIHLTTTRPLVKHTADGLLDNYSFDHVLSTDMDRKEFDKTLTEVVYNYIKG